MGYRRHLHGLLRRWWLLGKDGDSVACPKSILGGCIGGECKAGGSPILSGWNTWQIPHVGLHAGCHVAAAPLKIYMRNNDEDHSKKSNFLSTCK